MPAAPLPADADPPPPLAGPGPAGTAVEDTSPPAAASWALSAWGAAAAAPASMTPLADAAPDVDGMLRLALHDLRNALAAIQLGVELLSRRDGSATQPSATVLAHMDSAAQRAQALTLELDDLTRLAAGRGLPVLPVAFSLHAVVRDALDASRLFVPGVVVEHDRLGDGDCLGDPARMAQFLTLALEDLWTEAVPARVIVVTEVAGERFRLAVHADGSVGAVPAAAPALAQARRRLLLQAIAQAHGGHAGFAGGYASGGRSVEGSFSRLADPPLTAEQDMP